MKFLEYTISRRGAKNPNWQKRWNRAPTPAERRGLIVGYVRESILYREALAMGLDKEDTIIRRRLAQKLEFLSQDLVALIPPTEADLRAYFEAHVVRYQEPDLITLTHIFIDPDRRGEQTLEDAKAMRTKLQGLAHPTQGIDAFGDPFMLQRYYPQRSVLELSKLFGREFAQGLFDLAPGQWHGPVLSGYGVHLVYVHHLTEAPPSTFEAVQERVKQDWQDDKREKLNEQYYASLQARYPVVIEDDSVADGLATLKEQSP